MPDQLAFEILRLPDRRTTFHSKLLSADDQTIVLSHEIFPSTPFVHEGHEVIGPGYTAVWFLFKDQPFDIGRFYRPDGTWTGYYVDILEPVHWQSSDPHSLQPIVDLFLDLWITPRGGVTVLDEDEFEEALGAGHLSIRQAEVARTTLDKLVCKIERGEFPPPSVREWAT